MNEFLERLKQRKLVQWALAYIAAAFALIQVLDIVAQRFGWPEQSVRLTIIALAIGFFVALVLAWYHGERGAQRVTGTELLILALLLTIGGAVVWRLAPSVAEQSATNAQVAAPPATAQAIPHKSIAVLPFTDLSPAHDQEYFSDGMAEEILNALAKVKDLKVAGRTSSFSFKGKNEDLREIGKTLAVAQVLEGSVRKQGDKVRITAQLIQTQDGYHLWSETYDGDLSDVFALQEKIARAITDKLQVALKGDPAQPLVAVATTNPEAYALYLQATGTFNRRDGPRFPIAIAQLEQALKLDPKFARAHSRLAAIYALEPIYVPSSAASSRAAAEREAALAIELDPTLAEPYAALSIAYSEAGRLADSRDALERARAVNPQDVNTIFWAGAELISTGYTAQGDKELDRVLSIDPLLPNALLWRGIEYVYTGDIDHGDVLLRRASDVGLLHAGLGLHMVMAARGQTTQAIKQLADGLRVLGVGLPADAPNAIAQGVYGNASEHAQAVVAIDSFLATNPPRLLAVIPYALLQLGEPARALALLKNGSTTNDALFLNAIWRPSARAMRALPDFKAFTQKFGLVDLWDRFGPPDACQRIALGDYDCSIEATVAGSK